MGRKACTHQVRSGMQVRRDTGGSPVATRNALGKPLSAVDEEGTTRPARDSRLARKPCRHARRHKVLPIRLGGTHGTSRVPAASQAVWVLTPSSRGVGAVRIRDACVRRTLANERSKGDAVATREATCVRGANGTFAVAHWVTADADIAAAAVGVAQAAVGAVTSRAPCIHEERFVSTITVRVARAVLVRGALRIDPAVRPAVGLGTRVACAAREKRRTVHDGSSPQRPAPAGVVTSVDVCDQERRRIQARVQGAGGGGVAWSVVAVAEGVALPSVTPAWAGPAVPVARRDSSSATSEKSEGSQKGSPYCLD